MSDNDETDETLVILEQPRTEIVFDMDGNVRISQPRTYDNEDNDVFFNPLLIPELTRCLQVKWRDYCEAHDLPLVPNASPALPPPPTPEKPCKGGTR